MIVAEKGAAAPLQLNLSKKDTARGVRASIKTIAGVSITTVDLTHIGNGTYTGIFTHNIVEYLSVTFIIFTDTSFTKEYPVYKNVGEVYNITPTTEEFLSPIAKLQYINKASTVFEPFNDEQNLICWAEKDGIRQSATSDCVVTIKNEVGTIIWSQSESSPNSDGIYEFINPFSAAVGKNFYIIVTIKVDGSNRTNHFPFFTV